MRVNSVQPRAIAQELVEHKDPEPLTHVPYIRLTREPADRGNSRWKVQLGGTEDSHGASARLKTWSER
jgi:hypothetical protein